jgi:Zinc carboxypeptidase/Chitobiase/beta-hexosaminidase C-terminal domain
MSSQALRRVLIVVAVCASTWMAATGGAAAQVGRGIDPQQGLSLVEVNLPSKVAAMRLQLRASRYGVEFNEHYLRRNAGGSVTATVFGTKRGFARLKRAGYDLGPTIEGPATWERRAAQIMRGRRAERRASAAARGKSFGTASHTDEIVILRVDYFENYAGRFLSVEAKDRLGSAAQTGTRYIGPTLSLSWNTGPGTPISTPNPARPMSVNIDPDTTPDTYIEHRLLVRIGDVNTLDPPRPSRIRVGSSTGATAEADVNTWLGGGLPPMAPGFMKDFTTHYMDPTEVYQRTRELVDEFPNIARLVRLPYRTNGYQRRAQATMAGTMDPGDEVDDEVEGAEDRAVVLTSREWGHEGGNMISAEFRNPRAANSPLSVNVVGRGIVVRLGTDAAGAPSSTSADVVEAINGDGEASSLVVASTYRGSEGGGIVEPRARVNLSDFLSTETNAHVSRGPFRYHALRIGNRSGGPQGEKVGVFLYCQQHAREWATPLTCLETAEQLLRNYAIDPLTRRLVNNLDIFILPSSNPDGAHYSMHNFNFQRRNLTNHCVIGGKETDNPNAQNFWRPRVNPETGEPYEDTDPAARDDWGVDLNRNNTVGTIFDGYIGASHDCTSDVFTGPAEASEPEIRNEHWIADTFSNIKFSNNIHSFGGYFMWSPGAYLPDRSEGDLVHPNIGVEKYFFEAGDRILNRIKEHRNTVILPERTGPIADVLYSAGGNSADEHWYERDVIAYSFETGADRFGPTTLSVAAAAGATGIRVGNRNSFGPGDRVVFEPGTANEEVRFVASVPIEQNPPNPAPNVFLTEPLAFAHAAESAVLSPTTQQGVGFQPDYATEGKHEALEFSAGNYGLLESALEYAQDVQPPQVEMTGPYESSTQIDTTFQFINEPSVIHYTTDGSRPTRQSPLWDSTGPREPGEVFHLTETTTFRWLAEDIKGNVSRGSEQFVITPAG